MLSKRLIVSVLVLSAMFAFCGQAFSNDTQNVPAPDNGNIVVTSSDLETPVVEI